MESSNRKDWQSNRENTTKRGKAEKAERKVWIIIILVVIAIGIIFFIQTPSSNDATVEDDSSASLEDENTLSTSNESRILVSTKNATGISTETETSGSEDLSNTEEEVSFVQINPDDYDFSEVLSTFTVKHSSSSNRDFNMNLACSKINGMVLAPNQEFNWYGSNIVPAAVGQATKETGFKEAGVIINKKPSKGYGGGVCQVATTLYNAIMQVGIEPTEIHHHSIGSSYVPKGTDATVAYNDDAKYCKNFVFSNTLDFPIMIQMSEENGNVTATILKGNLKEQL